MPLSACEDAKLDAGVAYISDDAFNNLFDHDDDDAAAESGVLAIRISNKEDSDTDLDHDSIIMTCIPTREDDTIYLPEWAIDRLKSSIVHVERADLDAIPRAKTIKVKVIDNELYHTDIRDRIEELLYDFKFIQSNIILTVYLDCMGGYPAQIWIESVFDQDGIECIGSALLSAEVELDMGEPLERVPEFDPIIPEEPAVPAESAVPAEAVVEAAVPKKATAEQQRLAREARLKYFTK